MGAESSRCCNKGSSEPDALKDEQLDDALLIKVEICYNKFKELFRHDFLVFTTHIGNEARFYSMEKAPDLVLA